MKKLLAEAWHRTRLAFTGESARTFFDLSSTGLTPDPDSAPAALRCYEARSDLRAAFPLGLTPAGRRDFLLWVLKHGDEVGVSAGGALAALKELDARPDRGLVHTYRVQPEWQKEHPAALTARGWPTFRAWVSRRYRCPARWLRRAALAPQDADTPVSPQARGVNVVAPWRYVCGLQQEAVQIADALRDHGFVVGRRAMPAPPVSESAPAGAFLDFERFPVTLVKAGALDPFDATFPNCGLHPRAGVHRIAAWSWELEEFPPEPLAGATLANEFWTPSEFGAVGLRKLVADRPVLVMPPGVTVPDVAPLSRSRFGLPEDATLFLFTFDLSGVLERKNPLGLIEAFRRAFFTTDAAHLVLKVNRAAAYPVDFQRITDAARTVNATVLTGVLPREELIGLLNLSDSYVSLHRAEGFGFTVAEAMLCGKPVIATDYSATAEFLTADTGLPVRFEKVTLDRDCGPYRAGWSWADPDLDHAAERMRWVHDHPAEAKALGEKAHEFARTRFDPAASASRMAARLDAILAEKAK